jgi:hypothetical protein
MPIIIIGEISLNTKEKKMPGFLGLGGRLTDSDAGATAIDAAVLIVGAGLAYHFAIEPGIDWLGEKLSKDKDETPKPKKNAAATEETV